jgi:hypothetical protein
VSLSFTRGQYARAGGLLSPFQHQSIARISMIRKGAATKESETTGASMNASNGLRTGDPAL